MPLSPKQILSYQEATAGLPDLSAASQAPEPWAIHPLLGNIAENVYYPISLISEIDASRFLFQSGDTDRPGYRLGLDSLIVELSGTVTDIEGRNPRRVKEQFKVILPTTIYLRLIDWQALTATAFTRWLNVVTQAVEYRLSPYHQTVDRQPSLLLIAYPQLTLSQYRTMVSGEFSHGSTSTVRIHSAGVQRQDRGSLLWTAPASKEAKVEMHVVEYGLSPRP